MCGQYYIKITDKELRDIISGIEQEKEENPEQMSFFGDESDAMLKITPGMTVPVMTKDGKLQSMKWGFKNKDGKGFINMRSETAETLFPLPMQQGRCLIPASGYYERDRLRNIRYAFFVPKEIIYLAGCYRIEANSNLAKFVILTREATEILNEIHHRMPVVIPQNKTSEWLNESSDAMKRPLLDFQYEKV